jgi:hypothetical protein
MTTVGTLYSSTARTTALDSIGGNSFDSTIPGLLQQAIVAVGNNGGGGGGSTAWGAITGTLSNQTDLQTALNAKVALTGNTMTGLLQFTGTTHAGIRLNNLTTVQRDAIASPQAGMCIWNTTAARLQLHNGSAWTAGMVRLDGDTMTGALVLPVGSAAATALNFGTAGTGLYSAGTNLIGFATDGVVRATLGLAGGVGNLSITTPSGNPTLTSPTSLISIGSSSCSATMCNGLWTVSNVTGNLTSGNRAYLLSLGGDVVLQGDAADVLAQRRGANAQAFRVYGTFTDTSNYVRLALTTTSTTMGIVCQTAGTGADDIDLGLTTAGTGLLAISTAASADIGVASTHSVRMKFNGTEYKVLLATP